MQADSSSDRAREGLHPYEMQHVRGELIRRAGVRHWHRCTGCLSSLPAAQPSQVRSSPHQQGDGSRGWRWLALQACMRVGAAGSAAAVLFSVSAPAHCLDTETLRRPPKENLERCIKELESIGLGDRLSVEMENREQHAQDYSFHPMALPDVVVWPESTDEVGKILRVCNDLKVRMIAVRGYRLDGPLQWDRARRVARNPVSVKENR